MKAKIALCFILFVSICYFKPDGVLYFGAGCALGSVSLLAQLGGAVGFRDSKVGNEFELLSHLCRTTAKHAFIQAFKESPKKNAYWSWDQNKAVLSQVPAPSTQEKELLLFLEKRWLAKSTGFFSSIIDWVYPCFGISMQVNPETSSSYSRNPGKHLSPTYINRVEAWKKSLPHPPSFPLILTRPSGIQDYLPSYIKVTSEEPLQTTLETVASKKRDEKIVVDLTDVPSKEAYQEAFSHSDQIICIERVQQESISGIRILTQDAENHHRYLLEWIGTFGLSANRIELDRWPVNSNPAPVKTAPIRLSKEEFISFLNSFNWKSTHPQKSLMVKATLVLLQGLLASENKWNDLSLTQSFIIRHAFSKIKEQLSQLSQEDEKVRFFETASRLEEIHAHLSSLLEILAPFTSKDFPSIYRNILPSIPKNLQPLTTCGVHASGMTSLAGIFKAMEKTLGKPPHVLLGENTYFECINAAKQAVHATSIVDVTEDDWKTVDLILAQFNPVWKIDLQTTEYKIEKISEILHRALNSRNRPLTLALDCTLDYIDSPRVGELLNEFQNAIEDGKLNIICYRSGIKFDLLGMDNYSGAPFFMIHNQDPQWTPFDILLTDPALITDALSLNWFCLAYQSAAPHLELYRKQIFDNTRTLLSKVPSRLLKNSTYRITPFEQGVDPSFIDIKVSGPLHTIRGGALVGGCLYTECLEKGHQIFNRPSLGFYHPNFLMIFEKECTTLRLTLGLDPEQIDLFVHCFEKIDTLNGASPAP